MAQAVVLLAHQVIPSCDLQPEQQLCAYLK